MSSLHVPESSSLADFTSASLIAPQLAAGDTAGVIQELSRRLVQAGRIPDLLPFYQAVLNRELLVSTAMDYGMAFPHARLGLVKELSYALGKAAPPLLWGPKGAVPVDLVFLIAVPATEATNYMNLIAGLARLGKTGPSLDRIRAASGQDEILTVLSEIPIRQSKGAPA